MCCINYCEQAQRNERDCARDQYMGLHVVDYTPQVLLFYTRAQNTHPMKSRSIESTRKRKFLHAKNTTKLNFCITHNTDSVNNLSLTPSCLHCTLEPQTHIKDRDTIARAAHACRVSIMCSTNQLLSLGLVPSEAEQGGRVGADVASI